MHNDPNLKQPADQVLAGVSDDVIQAGYDDDDGAGDWYFADICRSVLENNCIEWYLDGGGSGTLTIDLRTGDYTLEGVERRRRELEDGEEERDLEYDELWEDVEFLEEGNMTDEADDEDGEVLLNADGEPVAFPSYVRLGYSRVTIEFHGCADEGDIGAVWFDEAVTGTLFLGHVTDASELALPDNVNGDLRLGGLTGVEKLELPQVVTGDVWLDGLTEPVSLTLPLELGGQIWLNGLEDSALLRTAQLATHDPDSGPFDLVGKSRVVTVPSGVMRDLTFDERIRHVDPLVVLETLRDPDFPTSCSDELHEDSMIGRTGLSWKDEPFGLAIGFAILTHPNRGEAESCGAWSTWHWSDEPAGIAFSQLGVLANPNCPQSLLDQVEQGHPEHLIGLLARAGELVGDPGLTVRPDNVAEVRAFARRFVEMKFAAALRTPDETRED